MNPTLGLVLLGGLLWNVVASARTLGEAEARRWAGEKLGLRGQPATSRIVPSSDARTLADADAGPPEIYLVQFEPEGWALVAADDAVRTPVLGYSRVGRFPSAPPAGVEGMLDAYRRQIRIVTHGSKAALASTPPRDAARVPSVAAADAGLPDAVAPLLRTTWGQDWPYNALCPADPEGPGGHVPVGCTAVAMGQILRYWGHPIQATGSSRFRHARYGELGVDFAEHTYDWDAMPEALTGENEAVAALLLHCGIVTRMDYGPRNSGAYGTVVDSALERHFGFASSVSYEYRQAAQRTEEDWLRLLRTELAAHRPVWYQGGTGVAHAWVCDGYEGEHFHMNWGWNGLGDGFYRIDRLTPLDFQFSGSERAIIGIQPDYRASGTLAGNVRWQARTIRVASDLHVLAGATLTLGPGTTLEFMGPFELRVDGTLLAQGTATAPVVFRARDPDTGWRGIAFGPSASAASTAVPESLLRGCVIRDVVAPATPGRGDGLEFAGALTCDAGSRVHVEDSRIYNNRFAGKGAGVVCRNGATVLLRDTAITDNSADEGGGVACLGPGSVRLVQVTIAANRAAAGGGLYCLGSGPIAENSILAGNTERQVHLADAASRPVLRSTLLTGGSAGIGGPGSGPVPIDLAGGVLDGTPTFLGSGAHPYRLRPGSTGIGVGDPLFLPEDDSNEDAAGVRRSRLVPPALGAYEAAPFLVLPSFGPASEAVTVALEGRGFGAAQGSGWVQWGGVPIRQAAVWSDSRIVCDVPGGNPGDVEVVIHTATGDAVTHRAAFHRLSRIEFVLEPRVTPTAGGEWVTLLGGYFGDHPGEVRFGSVPSASYRHWSNHRVVCAAPTGSEGSVEVSLVTANGMSRTAPSALSYRPAPVVLGLAPDQGSTAGGTLVRLTGSALGARDTSGARIWLGDVEVSEYVLWEKEAITFRTPAHPEGKVDVRVRTDAGLTARLPSAFEYQTTVQFARAATRWAEQAGTVEVEIRLSSPLATESTIPFTVSGTASGEGVDHDLASGTVLIPAGQTSVILGFHVTQDSVAEPDETVVIRLGTPEGPRLGDPWETTLTLTEAMAWLETRQEGEGRLAPGPGRHPVALDTPIPLVAEAGSGHAFDRWEVEGAGILADPQAPVSEVTLTGDASVRAVFAPITVQFSRVTSETPENAGRVEVDIELSAPLSEDLTVPFNLAGSAEGGGQDYSIESGQFRIPAGGTRATVGIVVRVDGFEEPDETVVLRLEPNGKVRLGTVAEHALRVTDTYWTPLHHITTAKPSSRDTHAMASVGQGRFVLFGGAATEYFANFYTPNDETWLYDLGEDAWRQLTPDPRPVARQLHAMTYAGEDRVLLFGGTGGVGGELNDTWIFHGSTGTWEEVRFSGRIPLARSGHSLAYLGDEQVLLCGGSSWTHQMLTDTWVLDLRSRTWRKVVTERTPGSMHNAAISYLGPGRALLYTDDDTWVFDLAREQWQAMGHIGSPKSPAPLERATMAYLGNGRAVMYTSRYRTTREVFDFSHVWIYDLFENRWSEIQPLNLPPPRASTTVAGAEPLGSSTFLMFAGNPDGPYLNDTWRLEVSRSKVNHPPRTDPVPVTRARPGELVAIDCAARDVDDHDVLSFSLADPAPAGAAVDARTGRFTWTPNETHAATTNRVIVLVSDDGTPPLTAHQELVIELPAPDHWPALPPGVSFESPGQFLAEDAGLVRIPVRLGRALPAALAVRVVNAGTALTSDYRIEGDGWVRFAAGSLQAFLDLRFQTNTRVQPEREIVLTLEPGTGARRGLLPEHRIRLCDPLATLAVSARGRGSVGPTAGSRMVHAYTPIPIRAQAAPDHRFLGWQATGPATLADPAAPETHVTLSGDAWVRAIFSSEITRVSPSGSLRSIQRAIDDAAPGDLILVDDGVYRENLEILKPIRLRSANGPAGTTILARDPTFDAVVVDGDDVEIDGFTIRGATQVGASAIHVLNRRAGSFVNNVLVGNSRGIRLEASTEHRILGNRFLDLHNEAVVLDLTRPSGVATRNTVAGNLIQRSSVGVMVIAAAECVVAGNRILDCGRGFQLSGPSFEASLVVGNTIHTNGQGFFLNMRTGNNNRIFLNSFRGNGANILPFETTPNWNEWQSGSRLTYAYSDSVFLGALGNDFGRGVIDANGDGVADPPPADSSAPYELRDPITSYRWLNPPALLHGRNVAASSADRQRLVLQGWGFGHARGSGRVLADGVEALDYPDWSDTRVVCEVPAGPPEIRQVVLQTAGGVSPELAVRIDPDEVAHGVVLEAVQVAEQADGTYRVRLTGQGFGDGPATGVVLLGHRLLPSYDVWTDREIVGRLPYLPAGPLDLALATPAGGTVERTAVVQVPPRLLARREAFRVKENSVVSFRFIPEPEYETPGILHYALGGNLPYPHGINAGTGEFTWMPDEAAGPGTYTMVMSAWLASDPTLRHDQSVLVTVDEVNEPPTLAPLETRRVLATQEMRFTVTAQDRDLPRQALVFRLAPGAPAEARIGEDGTFSWTPPHDWPPGHHVITIEVSDGAASASRSFTAIVDRPPTEPKPLRLVPGKVRYEYWTDLAARGLAALRADPRFPDQPTGEMLLDAFEAPQNRGENFGARLSAILQPPASGDYVFFLAADNSAELRLSPDEDPANAVVIAREPDWSYPRDWTSPAQRPRAENRSDRYPDTRWATGARIALQAGRRYYAEVLYEESGGGDHAEITWKTTGQPDPPNDSPPLGGTAIFGCWAAVVTPPAPLTLQRQGNLLRVVFEGTLESAPSVGGPWTAVPGASPGTPFLLAPDRDTSFLRSRR